MTNVANVKLLAHLQEGSVITLDTSPGENVCEKRTQARLQNEHEHVYEKMNTSTITESNPSVHIWRK